MSIPRTDAIRILELAEELAKAERDLAYAESAFDRLGRRDRQTEVDEARAALVSALGVMSRELTDEEKADSGLLSELDEGAWTCGRCGVRGFWSGGPHECTSGVPVVQASSIHLPETVQRWCWEVDGMERDQDNGQWVRLEDVMRALGELPAGTQEANRG